ncbi:MAG: formate dehydrogenase accessory sulfurtransferase FdhD [Pseudomonadota bacterium]
MTKFDPPKPAFLNPACQTRVMRRSPEGDSAAHRTIIHECAVAIVLNGTTVAVMMTSPLDIADFAMGFVVTEGYLRNPADVEEFEIITHPSGLEARFWVNTICADALKERRRSMLGPVGCGLCGIDSLEAAIRRVPPVRTHTCLSADVLREGFEALRDEQHLHNATHSCHAAGFVTSENGLVVTREDVGRHNALDKLIGSLLTAGISPAEGAIIMTSRISVELVQKAASVGCGILSGISGPSALAVETAAGAGMTLTGFHRCADFDVFCGETRIVFERASIEILNDQRAC